jgi:hypothetical protein
VHRNSALFTADRRPLRWIPGAPGGIEIVGIRTL